MELSRLQLSLTFSLMPSHTFTDVDSLKKQQQAMEIEQLKIQRSIQKLETNDLTDISNKLKSIDKKFDEFDEFQESTRKSLSEGNNEGDEKYSIIVAEMQKLKNQAIGFSFKIH